MEKSSCTVQGTLLNPEDYNWKRCGWDDCTASCGGLTGMIGVQTRKILCQKDGMVVSPSFCPPEFKPNELLMGCGKKNCTDYNWMADGPWGSCINGFRRRTFHCHDVLGGNAERFRCSGIKLPVAELPCEPDSCDPPTPYLTRLMLNNEMRTANMGHIGAVMLISLFLNLA